jgi:hypothetical protein
MRSLVAAAATLQNQSTTLSWKKPSGPYWLSNHAPIFVVRRAREPAGARRTQKCGPLDFPGSQPQLTQVKPTARKSPVDGWRYDFVPPKKPSPVFDGKPPVALHRPKSASPYLVLPIPLSNRLRATRVPCSILSSGSAIHCSFGPKSQIRCRVTVLMPLKSVRTLECFWYGGKSKVNNNRARGIYERIQAQTSAMRELGGQTPKRALMDLYRNLVLSLVSTTPGL